MSFTAGMPESGSSLGNTRQKFVDNFATIRTAIQANHENINNAGAGKHRFCQFMSVSAGATSATELALYNKLTGSGQRFFMRQSSSGTEIQLSGPDPVSTASGLTFLPGALLQIWDDPDIDDNGVAIRDNSPFLFPNGGFPNNCFVVVLQGQKAGNTVRSLWVKDGTLTNTGFSIRTDATVGEFTKIYYIAIGN